MQAMLLRLLNPSYVMMWAALIGERGAENGRGGGGDHGNQGVDEKMTSISQQQHALSLAWPPPQVR